MDLNETSPLLTGREASSPATFEAFHGSDSLEEVYENTAFVLDGQENDDVFEGRYLFYLIK